MAKAKIVTSFCGLGWIASRDDFDQWLPCGAGLTEEKAIADLLEQEDAEPTEAENEQRRKEWIKRGDHRDVDTCPSPSDRPDEPRQDMPFSGSMERKDLCECDWCDEKFPGDELEDFEPGVVGPGETVLCSKCAASADRRGSNLKHFSRATA